MAEFQRFRTSISGFNRQDVADYIERMSRNFGEKLRAREQECSDLRKEISDLTSQRDALAAKVKRLHELFGELEETFRTIDEEEKQ